MDIVICDVLDHYRAVLSGIKPKHTCTELLAAKLGQQVWVQTVRAIEATAVPVIKVSALPTGAVDSIRLDISFDAPSHRYCKAGHLEDITTPVAAYLALAVLTTCLIVSQHPHATGG